MDTDELAERVGPRLGELVHPGDADTPPFPLSLPTFQPNILPDGMTEEEAEELGLPTMDLPKLFLQALFHLLQNGFGVTLVDSGELADLQAAAAVREHKRVEFKQFRFRCGAAAFRVAVENFDSDSPIIPCEADQVQKAHTHG
ncbi:Gp80 [Mycolicibacterium canariasense]|uniref:Gp80 n=1 Tax=Mycolicibacterium canariasense TaxID=228230 RepID=A0A124E224_MYCCR|nr:hypothetical protein [Mycolicibacterium canariasense]MCV7212649.1 hypothetical protein [Mycolicibacterium canariasense]ORV02514.1 hypothetical protein AWB94_00820 [Mycolicibacterium canariasense]GAS95479.1 Gp80 [Mycolicibacterium canariasense]